MIWLMPHASSMGVLLQVAQALTSLRADMTADAEAVHANFVQQLMAGRRDAAAAIAQEHSELAAELQALGQQLNAALAGQQAKLTALVQAEVHQVGHAGHIVRLVAHWDHALGCCPSWMQPWRGSRPSRRPWYWQWCTRWFVQGHWCALGSCSGVLPKLDAALAGLQTKPTALVQAVVHQVGHAKPLVQFVAHWDHARGCCPSWMQPWRGSRPSRRPWYWQWCTRWFVQGHWCALGSCSGVLPKLDAALAGLQTKPTALVQAEVHQVGHAKPLVVKAAIDGTHSGCPQGCTALGACWSCPCSAAKPASLLPGRRFEPCRATRFPNSPSGAAFELLCTSLAQCSKPS